MRLFRSVIILLAGLAAATAQAREIRRVGWVEHIAISGIGSQVRAKMDTGAKTSSIDAEIIDIRKTGAETKNRTGDTVVFSLTLENNAKKTFERDVLRYVRIKKKDGGFIRRPVIAMTFCIADRLVNEEVNLANREGFIYPVLIGRNMMAHANLAIDPARSYMSRPTCELHVKKTSS